MKIIGIIIIVANVVWLAIAPEGNWSALAGIAIGAWACMPAGDPIRPASLR